MPYSGKSFSLESLPLYGTWANFTIIVDGCVCTGTTAALHLGRDPPLNECNGISLTCQQCEPFPKRTFITREDATFVAVIGPSANPRGYTAITGDQK